jgi:hypothetical protein
VNRAPDWGGGRRVRVDRIRAGGRRREIRVRRRNVGRGGAQGSQGRRDRRAVEMGSARRRGVDWGRSHGSGGGDVNRRAGIPHVLVLILACIESVAIFRRNKNCVAQ